MSLDVVAESTSQWLATTFGTPAERSAWTRLLESHSPWFCPLLVEHAANTASCMFLIGWEERSLAERLRSLRNISAVPLPSGSPCPAKMKTLAFRSFRSTTGQGTVVESRICELGKK